jgi:hypothetical protein
MFEDFDPLQKATKANVDEGALRERDKRSIHSILHSYVGWYDPFSELIQNALDAVDRQRSIRGEDFKPKVRVVIDAVENRLTVSDNGTGLDKTAFEEFLAPNVSYYKGNQTRGSKGVGATYVAYGFNRVRVDTKTGKFSASGEMQNARNWLHDENASENPRVYPTDGPLLDDKFAEFETGTSISVFFDTTTRPSELSWPNLNSAESWAVALRVKTALGSIKGREPVDVVVIHIDKTGSQSETGLSETGFLFAYEHFSRVKRLDEVDRKLAESLEKNGAGAPIPNSIKRLDAVYIDWKTADVIREIDSLDDQERELLDNHPVRIVGSYVYSANVWSALSKRIGCRPTAGIFVPGIQLAADNMPQGEVIEVPLRRYSGRQNQVHFVVHFENCIVDLGRKGFRKDFVDLARHICSQIVQHHFSRARACLRIDDVRKSDLLQQEKLNSWKDSLKGHEKERPLVLQNENFFKPINEVSITAEPSREQDVIALFNQLVAGGVIRGIKVVGTNEQMIYDGAFRIRCGPDYDNHEFEFEKNPLGIGTEQREDFEGNFPGGFLSSDLKILEYKFSVDGLIDDLNTGDKKQSEIDLVVAWEIGSKFEEYFEVQSLLIQDGYGQRDYHGLTHIFYDEHGAMVMAAIILSDLVHYLNDPNEAIEAQQALYE